MSKKPTMKDQFDEKYRTSTSEQLQKEILYQLFKSNEISEKIRSNTNTLIIWLVVLPLLAVLFLLMGDLFNS